MTVRLSLICLFFSRVIGVVGAWLQGSRFTWTRRIVQGYIQLFRNTPPLVQLYFFYFAFGSLLPATQNEYGLREPLFDNFTWAAISLSFFAGAFNVEIFKSEEHTSELQSLMRISYAVFCLKKKINKPY